MGNSLRDQLLKAGLVSEKQAKQAKKQQYNEQRAGGDVHAQKTREEKTAAAATQKAERDRLLNQQRKEAEERKAIAAQIRQLIEAHREPRGSDDIAYHFTHKNAIKRLYVSADVHQRITRGALAIVTLHGKYELVAREVAAKIRQRDAAAVVLQNESDTAGVDGDDPYAKYKVPDDLMW